MDRCTRVYGLLKVDDAAFAYDSFVYLAVYLPLAHKINLDHIRELRQIVRAKRYSTGETLETSDSHNALCSGLLTLL